MKRISLFLVLIAFVFAASAQTSKRSSVKNYIKYGEFDNAKKNIEQVVVHAKTKEDPLSWFYRARVYHAIYNIDSYKKADRATEADQNVAFYNKLDANPLPKAIESYKKALIYCIKDAKLTDYDFDKNLDRLKYIKAVQDPNTRYNNQEVLGFIYAQYLPVLTNTVANQGVTSYQKKDYKGALYLFEQAVVLSAIRGTVDTFSVYYAAHSAMKAEELDKSIKYFKEVKDLSIGKTDEDKAGNYYYLAKAYLAKNDTVHYLKTLKKGRKKYPKSSTLLVEIINYYITAGKSKEAKEMLIVGTKNEPNNKLLYFNLGTIYEKEDSLLKAVEMYNKTIEIDPNYVSGLYNLGALYNNKGLAMVKEADEIPPTQQKKYDAKLKEASAEFKKALPYLEKVHELDPKDKVTIAALKGIYYTLKDMPKYEEMNKLLKE